MERLVKFQDQCTNQWLKVAQRQKSRRHRQHDMSMIKNQDCINTGNKVLRQTGKHCKRCGTSSICLWTVFCVLYLMLAQMYVTDRHNQNPGRIKVSNRWILIAKFVMLFDFKNFKSKANPWNKETMSWINKILAEHLNLYVYCWVVHPPPFTSLFPASLSKTWRPGRGQVPLFTEATFSESLSDLLSVTSIMCQCYCDLTQCKNTLCDQEQL